LKKLINSLPLRLDAAVAIKGGILSIKIVAILMKNA
jgi:hypothetical protein